MSASPKSDREEKLPEVEVSTYSLGALGGLGSALGMLWLAVGVLELGVDVTIILQRYAAATKACQHQAMTV